MSILSRDPTFFQDIKFPGEVAGSLNYDGSIFVRFQWGSKIWAEPNMVDIRIR